MKITIFRDCSKLLRILLKMFETQVALLLNVAGNHVFSSNVYDSAQRKCYVHGILANLINSHRW